MQEDELGGQIELEGDELAAIIAFVHDEEEQLKFTLEDVPHDMRHFMMPTFVEQTNHEIMQIPIDGGSKAFIGRTHGTPDECFRLRRQDVARGRGDDHDAGRRTGWPDRA